MHVLELFFERNVTTSTKAGKAHSKTKTPYENSKHFSMGEILYNASTLRAFIHDSPPDLRVLQNTETKPSRNTSHRVDIASCHCRVDTG